MLLALALAACTGGDRRAVPAARSTATTTVRGPDALLLRLPKNGGVARVTAYPNLDSTVWTSSDAAPALDHVLAFDADAGLIAAADAHGLPVWFDLRTGAIPRPGKGKLRSLASVDGSTIYGVGTDGAVARFTPTGNWVFKPPQPARGAYPQANGTLLILGGRGEATKLWRIRPPETAITDTVALPDVGVGAGAPLGDRVFFVRPPNEAVIVRARTLEVGNAIDLSHRVLAIATTPSGDRAYVVLDSTTALVVVDPYQNRIAKRTTLPGKARDVRVDPFGRYVLVRAAAGDSVWVVSVGADAVVRTVHSQWRGDLPFVTVDGAIAVIDGEDVVFKGTQDVRVSGGASDFWYPFVWTGLRPRAVAHYSQLPFPSDCDSTTGGRPSTAAETTAAPPPTPPADSAKPAFTVSFAVLLDETRAREEASKISVNGQTARVVIGMTAGTTVYRVVLGPFATRDEAERVGHAANHTFVVYSGTP
jgi:hypothetical protein